MDKEFKNSHGLGLKEILGAAPSDLQDCVFLDYQSTTPCDPRVLDAMLPYFGQIFGNPHSKSHVYGWQAEAALENSRAIIADFINAHSKEIIFTSGATESNNLAIKGCASFYKSEKKHLITCVTEHKCVINCFRYLAQNGFDVTFLPVKSDGLLDLELLEKAIRFDTLLVSIMAVNNEIGVIQDLKAIGQICRSRGVFFHTDAAQGFGKIAIDVQDMNIDLLSISGHKIYGPKGVGALYVKKTRPRVRLEPLFSGGGQEFGLRSGTSPTPLCVGLAKATEVAAATMVQENQRLLGLRNKFLAKLKDNLDSILINGNMEHRIPGNLNVSFLCVEGESLMMAANRLAVSSGSACTSSTLEPSYVLKALGLSDDMAHTSLRFGFGRFTQWDQVELAADIIIAQVKRLRDLSPLWEMFQEGIDFNSIAWAE